MHVHGGTSRSTCVCVCVCVCVLERKMILDALIGCVQVTAESTAHLLEQVGKVDTTKVARSPSEGQLVLLEF